jgi:ABC-2 type transport system permease protein
MVVQERSTVVFMLLMPLLFTAIIGWIGNGDDAVENHPLVVANADNGRLGEGLIAHLRAQPSLAVTVISEAEMEVALEAEEAEAGLVVPPDFSDNLWAGETVVLRFQRQQNGNPESQQLIEQAVNTASNRLLGSVWSGAVATEVAAGIELVSNDAAAHQAYAAAAFEAAEQEWQTGAPVGLQVNQVSMLPGHSGVAPDGFGQSSPGMLVMFSLFFFMGGGIALMFERIEGTLPRLVVMPIDKASIILGKIIGTYFMGLVQMAVLISAGVVLFGVNWGQSPLALLITVLSYALTATGLGMVLGAFSRSPGEATALLNIGVMVVSALGGAWWPLEVTPQWMQTVGHFLPTAWVMDAFHDIVTRGLGVEEVLPEVAVLLGFAALFMLIGVWRFRYE